MSEYGKFSDKTLTAYLDYLASHMIILSDHINKNGVDDDNKNLITQYLEEIGEGLGNLLPLIKDDYQELYKGLHQNDTTKIIRDFKIRKIVDE